MTNHDLARAAAKQLLDCFDYEEIQAIIRATYAAPMAELERLKRQVAFVKRESILAIRDQRGRHIENKCLLCDGRWDVDCPEQHMENCPNEVAT